MKIAAMTMMAALTGLAAPAAEPKVTVCIENDEAGFAKPRAQLIASEMFARIGVKMDWRLGLRGCPPLAILISLSNSTPAGLRPGALAYALPFDRTHIRLFYDRIIQNHKRTLVPIVLAHVLVHEITHVLQGLDRHSDQGIMKAQWDEADFAQMLREPLSFTDQDIDLIHRGLATR